jgi:acyl-CoA synthetase (AMP-forming)/AMP-acid ligase II/acyl carrier protein
LLAPGVQPVTYGKLFGIVRRARSWLASQGLSSAARVAVLIPAGFALDLSCLAIACGAVCIPLNPSLAEPELLVLLEDARADAVIGLQDDPVPARLAQTLGLVSLVFHPKQWVEDPTEGITDPAAPGPGPLDTALVLMTSGTTGRSKRVPILQRQLVQSARQTADHLGLRSDDRGLLLMPAFHSQGLIVGLLAPLAAGSTVVCAPVFEAAGFVRWLAEYRPTWYTASPMVHQVAVDFIGRLGAGTPPHAFRMIRSASSALPEPLQSQLEALWGVPIIQGYGITETAGQVSCNPLVPHAQKPGSVGRPAGADLRVIDARGNPLPAGRTGSVMVRGPSVFGGYEDAPEMNATVFRDGWFDTGDLGWVDEEGYLFLAGRSREMINRGGEKIAPSEVEQALLRLSGVAQAVAYPAAHPTLGENVHAAVVPARGSSVDGQVLRTALSGVIAGFKIPACIHVVDRIPLGAGGKIQRRDLHHQIKSMLADAPVAEPLTPLQTQIAAVFARVLGQPAIAFDANFLAIGGDSLSAARLVLEVNEGWGVDLSASALLARPTVTTFAALLQAAVEDADTLSKAFQSELDALSDEEVAMLLGDGSPRIRTG